MLRSNDPNSELNDPLLEEQPEEQSEEQPEEQSEEQPEDTLCQKATVVIAVIMVVILFPGFSIAAVVETTLSVSDSIELGGASALFVGAALCLVAAILVPLYKCCRFCFESSESDVEKESEPDVENATEDKNHSGPEPEPEPEPESRPRICSPQPEL